MTLHNTADERARSISAAISGQAGMLLSLRKFKGQPNARPDGYARASIHSCRPAPRTSESSTFNVIRLAS